MSTSTIQAERISVFDPRLPAGADKIITAALGYGGQGVVIDLLLDTPRGTRVDAHLLAYGDRGVLRRCIVQFEPSGSGRVRSWLSDRTDEPADVLVTWHADLDEVQAHLPSQRTASLSRDELAQMQLRAGIAASVSEFAGAMLARTDHRL